MPPVAANRTKLSRILLNDTKRGKEFFEGSVLKFYLTYLGVGGALVTPLDKGFQRWFFPLNQYLHTAI
jgi:hypothetical protein